MKITKYAMMFLAGAAVLLSGCQDLEGEQAYAPENVVAPVLGNLPAEIVITAQNMALETVNFTWQPADFGVSTQVNYSVEASYGDGGPQPLFIGLAETSTEQVYEALNTKLALAVEDGGFGVPVDTPSAVKFYISATIGTGYVKVYSEPKTVMVTVTAAERVFPKIWVIGDYCGWNHGNSQFMYDFTGNGLFEAIVDFGEKAANGFKLTGADNWDNGNWGTDGDAPAPEPEAASITLIDSGGSGNISAYSQRFYRFKFDRSSLTLTKDLSFDRLGVIGSATPTGWDSDTEMQFDPVKQRFWVDMTLVEGEIKFRANAAWDHDWGGANGIVEYKGGNIVVPAGNYRIYVNMNNSAAMTYELNADDYGTGEITPPEPPEEPERAAWYLHGQTAATPDWGETPFVGAGTDGFKLTGIEVAANSQFLFKSGDDSQWIGPLKQGSDDPFTVTVGTAFTTSSDKVNANIEPAGTYDYWFLPKQNIAYVMTAGEKPGVVPDSWGIVGNLTDWGGGVGDFAMVEENGYQVRKNIWLGTDYEFKVRQGNDWNGTDKGTDSTDPVEINTGFATGANNIKVATEGLYDIYFDETASMIYIMTAGEVPAE